MSRYLNGAVFGAGLLVVLLAPPGGPVAAAVITVGGACNLHAAIEAANTDSSVGGCPAGSGADIIRLTATVGLTVVDNNTDGANGLPSVTSDITIEGDGFAIFRQPVATPAFRIFHVARTAKLTLDNVLVSFGLSLGAHGGGIYNRGDLTLRNSMVSLNKAQSVSPGVGPNGIWGGGIFSAGGSLRLYSSQLNLNTVDGASWDSGRGGGLGISGPAEIVNSTIDGNLATVDDEGGARGGGIFAVFDMPLAIVDSTVANNRVEGGYFAWGGGVDARGIQEITVINTTFSGNTATTKTSDPSEGGGLMTGNAPGIIRHATFCGNSADSAAALEANRVTVSGTLFANSSSNHCEGPFIDGGGGNLADDSTCALTIAGTLAGLDPVLADNGGPTETHQLLPGSTAIDIAGACGLSFDQRGAGRATPCDAGAYENIGCPLQEIKEQTIDTWEEVSTCHTAVLGPDLLITGSGSLDLSAGYIVTIQNGVEIEDGGELNVEIQPPPGP